MVGMSMSQKLTLGYAALVAGSDEVLEDDANDIAETTSSSAKDQIGMKNAVDSSGCDPKSRKERIDCSSDKLLIPTLALHQKRKKSLSDHPSSRPSKVLKTPNIPPSAHPSKVEKTLDRTSDPSSSCFVEVCDTSNVCIIGLASPPANMPNGVNDQSSHPGNFLKVPNGIDDQPSSRRSKVSKMSNEIAAKKETAETRQYIRSSQVKSENSIMFKIGCLCSVFYQWVGVA